MTFVGHDTLAACTDDRIKRHHGEATEPAWERLKRNMSLAMGMPSQGNCFFGVVFGILEEFCLDVKFEIHQLNMDVSENRGTPQMGYPYFWKHPYTTP